MKLRKLTVRVDEATVRQMERSGGVAAEIRRGLIAIGYVVPPVVIGRPRKEAGDVKPS